MTVVAEPGTRWTVDDVLKLAPDAASAGAARRLSLSAVWSQAGSSGSLLWGRCQGSAREPYQVTIDLDEPSFRCTCPSRKQPCKHGLGLLLLWADGGGSVADDARPADFAADWVQRLAARGPGVAGGAGGGALGGVGRDGGRGAGAAPDPEAQARRLAQRIETMSAGIDEFERWLLDLVRQGLASARHQPYAFWDAAAARLVDAQMPGLADRVRALPGLAPRPPRGPAGVPRICDRHRRLGRPAAGRAGPGVLGGLGLAPARRPARGRRGRPAGRARLAPAGRRGPGAGCTGQRPVGRRGPGPGERQPAAVPADLAGTGSAPAGWRCPRLRRRRADPGRGRACSGRWSRPRSRCTPAANPAGRCSPASGRWSAPPAAGRPPRRRRPRRPRPGRRLAGRQPLRRPVPDGAGRGRPRRRRSPQDRGRARRRWPYR